MSREVRRVPPDWQHPKKPNGKYLKLCDDYGTVSAAWDEGAAKWREGLCASCDPAHPWMAITSEDRGKTFAEHNGERPVASEYMPVWAPEQATHYMMYETCSDGTPISPAFATPQELARWLFDNNASAFGSATASYEAWLRVARGHWAPSVMIIGGVVESGVEAVYRSGQER